MMARPAAPTPDTTTRTSAGFFSTTRRALVQRREDHDGGAVLIVVEHRDVQQVPQPALDLEASGRGDVFEVDPAEPGRDGLTMSTISSMSWVSRHDRPGVDAAELLEQHAAFPSITGMAAAGPMLPRPEHRGPVGHHRHGVPFDRQPAERRLGFAAIARHTRATPGV